MVVHLLYIVVHLLNKEIQLPNRVIQIQFFNGIEVQIELQF